MPDPLTQQLAQRAMPAAAPQEDTPPLGFLQKPFEGGMDTLLSAIGIRGQKPGDLATGLGSAIGAATMAPKLPFGAALHGLGGVSDVSQGVHDVSPLLKEIFASNPAAEAAYNRMMTASAPEYMAQKSAGQTAKYAQGTDLHDALLDLDVAGRGRPIKTDTGYATAIPLGRPQMKPSASSAKPGVSGMLSQMGEATPQASGITDDMVRDIRSMDPQLALQKYAGQISPTSLTKIILGSMRGDVK